MIFNERQREREREREIERKEEEGREEKEEGVSVVHVQRTLPTPRHYMLSFHCLPHSQHL